ncbi:MAG TPA: ferredoxin [Verrucomicrobiae bacterium]|nr:ferredoxin [Verrucomicrobiae bacterium]
MYFVTENCIDCDLCRQTAPHVFKRQHVGNTGYSYVYAQPSTPRDEHLADEAKCACPVDAIGEMGQNWQGEEFI